MTRWPDDEITRWSDGPINPDFPGLCWLAFRFPIPDILSRFAAGMVVPVHQPAATLLKHQPDLTEDP